VRKAVLLLVVMVISMSGCVMKSTAQKMYVQGRVDSFTELVNLQARAGVLEGCKDLVRRAFPETPAAGFEQIDARLTQAVNAPVVAPSPSPSPSPSPKPTPRRKKK
jgi:hypothetical protein